MALPQFGYNYPSSNNSLTSSQLLMPSSPPVTSPSALPGVGGGGGGAGGGTASANTPGGGTGAGGSPGGGSGGCCEGGRILGTNPHTGQPLCSCQYSPGLLTYSRVAAGLSDSVYPPSPYATPGYVPFGPDPSAFYPPLTSAYDLKEAGDTWRGISQPTACYPYDPGMPTYPYSNAYGAMDINSAARRKNATRENTNTLKAWLYEHRKNPYPTKGEKIMLAIITKMTLTQVSTWFANARRRLKKENKMTWSPRNRSGDGDEDGNGEDDDDDDEDGEKRKDEDEDGDGGGGGGEKGKEGLHIQQLGAKEENGFRGKEEKDCALSQTHPPDNVVHAKRLFEDDSHSPLNPHSHKLPPHSHHPLSSLQPPQPPSLLHHPHRPQQHQQHSPHDGGNFMGITSSSSQPFPGLTSPEAVGLSSPLDTSKRPDSLCSNSNDSGLSDVNCNFSAEAQAAAAAAGMDASAAGFRPKIWSLAHVATSDTPPSPYLSSGGLNSMPGGRPVHSMGAPRSPGMETKSMGSLSGIQPWGTSPSSAYSTGIPSSRPGSFGMGSMNMNHQYPHKSPPMPHTPMFSHPALSGNSSGLGPSNSGYTQLSSFYPQTKLSID